MPRIHAIIDHQPVIIDVNQDREALSSNLDFLFPYDCSDDAVFIALQNEFARALQVTNRDERLQDRGSKIYAIDHYSHSSMSFKNPIDVFLILSSLHQFFHVHESIRSDELIAFEKMRLKWWKHAVDYATEQLREINEYNAQLRNGREAIIEDMENQFMNRLRVEWNQEREENKRRYETFLQQHTAITMCENSFNLYVAYGERRNAWLAMRLTRQCVNSGFFTSEQIQTAANRIGRNSAGKRIGQSLFDLDPFTFSTMLPAETKEESSYWTTFRSWIARTFGPAHFVRRLVDYFTSNETLAKEGNAEAQYKLGVSLKNTNQTQSIYWLARVAASSTDLSSSACFELANAYIAKFLETREEDVLLQAAEWCNRAAQLDRSNGLRMFIDRLYAQYGHSIFAVNPYYQPNTAVYISEFFAKKSLQVRLAVLRHPEWLRLSGNEDDRLRSLMSGYSHNGTVVPWTDDTAVQALNYLATLDPALLRRNFGERYSTFFSNDYTCPKACLAILASPVLMGVRDTRDESSTGYLLLHASPALSACLETAAVSTELLAFIHYAERTDLRDYNRSCTGLWGLDNQYALLLRGIAVKARTNPAYARLLDQIYAKSESHFAVVPRDQLTAMEKTIVPSLAMTTSIALDKYAADDKCLNKASVKQSASSQALRNAAAQAKECFTPSTRSRTTLFYASPFATHKKSSDSAQSKDSRRVNKVLTAL